MSKRATAIAIHYSQLTPQRTSDVAVRHLPSECRFTFSAPLRYKHFAMLLREISLHISTALQVSQIAQSR